MDHNPSGYKTPTRLFALAALFALLLPACSPTGDSRDGTAEPPPPRITAEHPVTSLPALEAGLVDRGAMVGGSMFGDDGPVHGGPVHGLGGGGTVLGAVLPAHDVAASIDFYSGLLGFEVTSSQPAEPPFRRVELTRGGVQLVLLRTATWEREMPRFGAPPEAGGEPEEKTADGDEEPGAEGEADQGADREVDGSGGGAGPVLRLALEDLPAVAQRLAEAGVVLEGRDGGGAEARASEGGHLALVDPSGNRLILVSAGEP